MVATGRAADERQNLFTSKDELRQRVWDRLEAASAVPIPPGAHDRIPNFFGREHAAKRLAARPDWRSARVIKANPDKAQLPVRTQALREGKRVYMAVPRLAGPTPFVLLDPERLGASIEQAATSDQGPRVGIPVALEDVEDIDLVVCGSVAVNREGARLGKGGGFSDIEVALLVEAGRLRSAIPIVTTVHDLQVVDREIPESAHDFRVQVVITPTRTIEAGHVTERAGIIWADLDDAKLATIPVLAARQRPHYRDLP